MFLRVGRPYDHSREACFNYRWLPIQNPPILTRASYKAMEVKTHSSSQLLGPVGRPFIHGALTEFAFARRGTLFTLHSMNLTTAVGHHSLYSLHTFLDTCVITLSFSSLGSNHINGLLCWVCIIISFPSGVRYTTCPRQQNVMLFICFQATLILLLVLAQNHKMHTVWYTLTHY